MKGYYEDNLNGVKFVPHCYPCDISDANWSGLVQRKAETQVSIQSHINLAITTYLWSGSSASLSRTMTVVSGCVSSGGLMVITVKQDNLGGN